MATTLGQFRGRKDELFATSDESPLGVDQRALFRGLPYYPEQPALAFEVALVPVEDDGPLLVPTSTGEDRAHRRAGAAALSMDGRACG